MNWLDFVFIAILITSVIAGASRGLARVAIGLAATILGILFAARWYSEAGFFLRPYVSSPSVANGIGFILILLVFLVAGALIGMALAAIFKWVGLSWLDRFLGALFGVVRAALIAIAVVMIGMAFPRSTLPEAIIHSHIAPYVVDASRMLAAITPDEMKDAFYRNYGEVKKVWEEMMQRKAKKLPTTTV